jgi:hypothetical protein
MFQIKTPFYDDVDAWVKADTSHLYYLFPTQQKNTNFVDFCSAVLDNNKVPVIITNIAGMNNHYPPNLRNAMSLSDDVLVYEVAKMGLNTVLKARADFFVNLKGGIIWTQS